MTLKPATMCYHDDSCYQRSMRLVEERGALMLRELARHGALSLARAVQFVADHIQPGGTFTEALAAIYAYNKYHWGGRLDWDTPLINS